MLEKLINKYLFVKLSFAYAIDYKKELTVTNNSICLIYALKKFYDINNNYLKIF